MSPKQVIAVEWRSDDLSCRVLLAAASEDDQVSLTGKEYASRERGLHDGAREERSKTKLYCARLRRSEGRARPCLVTRQGHVPPEP